MDFWTFPITFLLESVMKMMMMTMTTIMPDTSAYGVTPLLLICFSDRVLTTYSQLSLDSFLWLFLTVCYEYLQYIPWTAPLPFCLCFTFTLSFPKMHFPFPHLSSCLCLTAGSRWNKECIMHKKAWYLTPRKVQMDVFKKISGISRLRNCWCAIKQDISVIMSPVEPLIWSHFLYSIR